MPLQIPTLCPSKSPHCAPPNPHIVPLERATRPAERAAEAQWSSGPLAHAGKGTVVTGRLEQGTLRPGMSLELVGLGAPRGQKLVVGALETFRKTLSEAIAGDQVRALAG